MRRLTIWFSSTATIVALLFSYRTSTIGGGIPVTAAMVTTATKSSSGASPTPSGVAATGGGSGGGTTATPPAPSSAAGATSVAPTAAATGAATGAGTAAAKTVTGQSVDTRWGPVQVQITVSGTKISAVNILVYPNGNQRDAEINSYALPVLVQETLSAQSAHIDSVSGASVTSGGYISSLQSALDAAHL